MDFSVLNTIRRSWQSYFKQVHFSLSFFTLVDHDNGDDDDDQSWININ